ncbi:recombinase family protein [Aestuariivirga sp.]|uniref:recombinase family protein n=1 Tax=Aestuariivirga sp. TaxID=2650926 RepID=UPI0039E6D6CA
MANPPKTIRCAIYTRKSSEEGLEQDFNSLDAQREACEAYIKSQKHEGWEAVPHKYDDGGYSGGTLERPALDALLGDIRQKRIDVVVVYKIDRLTRSLFDFSKIVEIFDAGGVSFVSVTQKFNTTTSMGRLTLNVLLSFAQFEREVTGERIRDKIAASKKKGMWMGGCVPFGYRVEKRELVIDEPEAQHVRMLYEKYLELGSVRAVKDAVDALGITSRPTSKTSGSLLGRGHIYRILTNLIYMDKISHKGILSDGQHEAIIEAKVSQRVQEMLQANNARERDQPNAAVSSPLAGLIFDEQGERLTPSHAVKGGRRYRYYISNVLVREPGNTSGIWLSAPEIEAAVCQMI